MVLRTTGKNNNKKSINMYVHFTFYLRERRKVCIFNFDMLVMLYYRYIYSVQDVIYAYYEPALVFN